METKEEFYRNNCSICNNQFDCELVKKYDETKDLNLIENCKNFDDVYKN